MMVLELIEGGGWMMWVILGVSVIALAITLDRVFMLFIRSGLNIDKFRIRIVLGDQVRLAVSPYDPTRGRIIYRIK